ncbi:restriction endonuclease subunit S [Flavobacterium humidisoli]|uniref:Restriction endonuclease subunit S n=1 Tax=Flavobacterium humidisoli TaxID=2937442 RepID=A0ABY4M261_9FLAO|nr:restriction endonuclease subunit S [Flavobacterium humidisoli]UPZ17936.1 restriction endonuclease subunit S [Flavobacterium humidisoli]
MSWSITNLRSIIKNFSVKAKNQNDLENLIFFGVNNDSGIMPTKNAATDKASEYKIIEKGCFVYNPYRINVGSIGYYEGEDVGLVSPAYVVFKIIENTVLPEILLRFLKSPEGIRQINKFARGTVRKALRFDDLVKIEIPLPPIADQIDFWRELNIIEQKNIDLKNELENQKGLIVLLRRNLIMDALKGSLKNETVEDLAGGLVTEENNIYYKEAISYKSNSNQIPFKLPNGWKWSKLRDIAIFLNGYAFKSSWFKSDGIPLLRNINMGVNEITWNDIAYVSKSIAEDFKQYWLTDGDIVLSLDRPIIKAGLKVAQISEIDTPCLLVQRVLKISPIDMNSDYLYAYLNSDLFLNYIDPGKSIGIPHISSTQVSLALIPVPPKEEQIKIVDQLKNIFYYCNDFEKDLEKKINYANSISITVLSEFLGIKAFQSYVQSNDSFERIVRTQIEESNMQILEILEKRKEPLTSLDVWKQSVYSEDIEKFYAELKKLIDVKKLVVEYKEGKKSYLKLAENEN